MEKSEGTAVPVDAKSGAPSVEADVLPQPVKSKEG